MENFIAIFAVQQNTNELEKQLALYGHIGFVIDGDFIENPESSSNVSNCFSQMAQSSKQTKYCPVSGSRDAELIVPISSRVLP